MFDWQAKAAICRYGKRLYTGGYIVAHDGNISLRCAPEHVLITKTQVCKGDLRWGDIIRVNIDGDDAASKAASSEYRMHLTIYRQHPEIRAIIHTHPPFTTAFAVAGRAIKEPILPEMVLTEPEIPLVPYAPPATQELAELVSQHLGASRSAILRNHGLVTVGDDLEEAYWRTERCEQMCRIYLLSYLLGGAQTLDAGQIKQLRDLFNKNRDNTC